MISGLLPPIPNAFTVTNNVTQYSLYTLPDNAALSGGNYALGSTDPANPYENFTISGLSPSVTLQVQIVELGNSLALISGKMTSAQELERDNDPNPDSGSIFKNNAPGLDLLRCLTIF